MKEAADVVELLDSRLPPLGRLRNGALEGRETVPLSAKADCPDPDNAANADILTDEEREAVGWCVEMAVFHATDCDDEIATLRGLLERL